MMGRTHALSGALAMLVTAPVLDRVEPSLAPQGAVQLAAAAVCCAGAALLPDLDHPGSTVARSFGAATEALARWVARRLGGHRGGTHSVPFILMAAGVSGLVGGLPGWFVAVPAALIALLVGLAARALGARNTADTTAVTAVIVLAAARAGVDVGSWLGVAVGLGVAAHVAGDCLTVQGCPLWWPVPRYYRAAALTTNGTAERVIAWTIVAGIAAVTWATAAGTATTGHRAPRPAGLYAPGADVQVLHRHTDA